MHAICRHAEWVAPWRKAFPDGSLSASLEDAVGARAAADQLWLHAGGLDERDAGRLVARAVSAFPGVPIVVMSDAPAQAAALQALHGGARGYCHAQSHPDLLRQIALVVAHGGLWIGPELMQRVLGSVNARLDGQTAPTGNALSGLTPRERAVALEVAKGATNKEAARALEITERTVKAHLAAAFEKLGVRDRLELAIRVRDSAPVRSVA